MSESEEILQECEDELTNKQQLAIPALLGSRTVREAAKQSGVSEATLYRWLRSQAFQVAYRESCRGLVHQAMGQLQQVAGEAVETLREVMASSDAPATARVGAAKVTLDNVFKVMELERLENRVLELEELIERIEGRRDR